jgi:hypothetical protein
MDTISIGPSCGEITQRSITMDAHWLVTMTTGQQQQPMKLALVAAFPWKESAIYLFGSLDRSGPPVEGLPHLVSELLIFSPLVALRRLPLGFQGLTTSEWEELVLAEMAPARASVHSLRNATERPQQQEVSELASSSSSDLEMSPVARESEDSEENDSS